MNFDSLRLFSMKYPSQKDKPDRTCMICGEAAPLNSDVCERCHKIEIGDY